LDSTGGGKSVFSVKKVFEALFGNLLHLRAKHTDQLKHIALLHVARQLLGKF
jgi:hypothetical protein